MDQASRIAQVGGLDEYRGQLPTPELQLPSGQGVGRPFRGPLNEREKGDKGRRWQLPKTVKYDGKGNWQAFFTKFARYAEMSGWDAQECKDQLCFCLEGKASEYYALVAERNNEVDYTDLVQKLEKRFGFREIPETAQIQFQNAKQGAEEDLEDWADRVLSLATRAFRELPDHHMYQQAVLRICQGASDKEAGSAAANVRPKNIEEAVNR